MSSERHRRVRQTIVQVFVKYGLKGWTIMVFEPANAACCLALANPLCITPCQMVLIYLLRAKNTSAARKFIDGIDGLL